MKRLLLLTKSGTLRVSILLLRWCHDEGWGAVTGPGVGMQVTFWDNMLFRFELPLGFRYGSDGFGIMPLPNTALMYRW